MKKIQFISFAAFSIIASSASAADQAFNLICSGTLKSEIVGHKPKFENYSYEFRVDLDNLRYCYSKTNSPCGSVKNIQWVDEHLIYIRDKKEQNGNEKTEEHEFINRSTGNHFASYVSIYTDRSMPGLFMMWEGSCVKTAFSGFPRFYQKF